MTTSAPASPPDSTPPVSAPEKRADGLRVAGAFATAGIDWDDAHEVDAVSPHDGFAACAWAPQTASVGDWCLAGSGIAWGYAEVNCSEQMALCVCRNCRLFWASPTCTDPEQAPPFTSGDVS